MAIQGSRAGTIMYQELTGVLEPLIRRIVREELAPVVANRPDVFDLEPESPLHADMVEILERHNQGATKLYSRDDVWDE
jgi:hypothetical protein